MSDACIVEAYEFGRKNGAAGGKHIGAGSSGSLMFYCENSHKHNVIEAMLRQGLRWKRFRFDLEGVKILVNA